MLAECRSKAWMEAELGFGIWLFLFVFALFNGPAHCNSSKLAPLEFHGVASAENPTLYVVSGSCSIMNLKQENRREFSK